jgi:hypothetical protein
MRSVAERRVSGGRTAISQMVIAQDVDRPSDQDDRDDGCEGRD